MKHIKIYLKHVETSYKYSDLTHFSIMEFFITQCKYILAFLLFLWLSVSLFADKYVYTHAHMYVCVDIILYVW